MTEEDILFAMFGMQADLDKMVKDIEGLNTKAQEIYIGGGPALYLTKYLADLHKLAVTVKTSLDLEISEY